MQKKLNLFTHNGPFHADEVFATAMLSLMAEEINVVRGSDEELPEDPLNWIIYDIGGGELDHHTPENKENNGCHPGTLIPYAACGLVWRKYYKEILNEQGCPESYFEQVYSRMESSLILGIDAADNGVNPVQEALREIDLSEDEKKELVFQSNTAYTLSDMIRDFNPPWNSTMDYMDAFNDAVSFSREIFLNRLDSILSALDGADYVRSCISFSSEHILFLDRFAPWEGILYSLSGYDPKARDIWYVVFPSNRSGWNVQCALRNSDDRTSYRHPLPASWYGLRYQELSGVCGIEGAVFCHPSGFLAGTRTQQEAMAMARLACRK